MEHLVIIPARGGSKGVPNKNKKLLNGKPLIQYTIEAALQVFKAEEICVSTDDIEIFNLAIELGVKPPFLRPDNLATDTASSRDVLLHSLNYYEEKGYAPKQIILLQPTSPFRNANHIREAKNKYNANLEMVVSVFETKANPYFNLYQEDENGYLAKCKKSNFTRRQDCPKVFEFNGAIYVINPLSLKQNKISDFKRVVNYIMNEEDSHDIDTLFDWTVAKFMMENSKK